MELRTGAIAPPNLLQRYPALVFAMIAAQAADLVTFLIGIGRLGIHAEQNPLVRNLYLSAGPPGPVFLKVAVVGLVFFLVERIARRFHGSGAVVAAMLPIGVGVIGVFANVSATLRG